MPSALAAKGKKRAVEDVASDAEGSDASSATGSGAPLAPAKKAVAKKPKRAETRACPVCDEAIPIRLLEKHYNFEMERVEEIIQQVGSTEVLADAEPDDGLTSRSRRSAVKARKSTSSSAASTSEVTLELSEKTVRALKRHRKQRNAKLRELTRDDDETQWWGGRYPEGQGGDGTVCPVCARVVRGDVDVIEAHVDSCLAHARILEERERAREGNRDGAADDDIDADVDVDGEEVRESVTNGVSFRGTGFDTRNRALQDVDDDIDVDGDDDVVFGAPQFTENDIVALSNAPGEDSDADVDVEQIVAPGNDGTTDRRDSQPDKSLNDLVAERYVKKRQTEGVEDVKRTMDEVMGIGEMEQAEETVKKARLQGDMDALIRALEGQVSLMKLSRVSSSTSLLCRICLDPYSEPTVSTGCWHTCCRECWLRCLGSTKLCPICKRITAAADLRRIYL